MSSSPELIAACKKGDRKAQEKIFLEHRDAIYTTSLKYCRNIEEAQDNVHDAFVIVFETINKYKGKGSFAGWIQRIAINQAVKKYRSKQKVHLTEDPSWFSISIDDDQWASSCDLDQLLEFTTECTTKCTTKLHTLWGIMWGDFWGSFCRCSSKA